MPINTVGDLHRHLAIATRVELSTIPPYLYAMYSIKDQDSDAAKLIASVVVEEMLHVTLVTNLLLAVGGEPDFRSDVIPRYPSLLLNHTPDLPLSLGRCTQGLIRDTFMVIESPAAPGALPEDDVFETLGQFYAALMAALERQDAGGSLYRDHQAHRQLADPSFYSPVKFDAEDSGGLMLISDKASADRALEIIVDQGEGLSDERWADPSHQELTHFSKFEQLASGVTPIGDVWPVPTDPRTSDYPPTIRPVSDLFNALYGLMFVTMGDLFNGDGEQPRTVAMLYTLMGRCLAPIARYLVQIPIDDGHHAAPTFETHSFGGSPWVEASALAASVAEDHPALAETCDRITSLRRTG
jgi:rubrerythrin